MKHRIVLAAFLWITIFGTSASVALAIDSLPEPDTQELTALEKQVEILQTELIKQLLAQIEVLTSQLNVLLATQSNLTTKPPVSVSPVKVIGVPSSDAVSITSELEYPGPGGNVPNENVNYIYQGVNVASDMTLFVDTRIVCEDDCSRLLLDIVSKEGERYYGVQSDPYINYAGKGGSTYRLSANSGFTSDTVSFTAHVKDGRPLEGVVAPGDYIELTFRLVNIREELEWSETMKWSFFKG